MRAVQFVADLHVYRSQVGAKTSLKLGIEHDCTLTVLVKRILPGLITYFS